MQRMNSIPVEHWSDKVMSVMREQQLEACQERLTHCPERGLFEDISASETRELFNYSFYSREMSHKEVPVRELLRFLTLSNAEKEACFLSSREDALVKRMVIGDGTVVLEDWEDITAAEALIKRLWCTIVINEEKESATLRLAEPLKEKIILGLSDVQNPPVRSALFSFDAMLHALLYLSGFLHAQIPVNHLEQELKKDKLPYNRNMIYRYLEAAFDYSHGERRDMLLLHPGLYDPEHLLGRLEKANSSEVHLTSEMMLGGMNGILPEEVASTESMRGALHGAVRPEMDENETLEDLRMMAKQGASLEEMREVLESSLCVLPTPRMVSALSQLHLQTVRWVGMPSAVLN